MLMNGWVFQHGTSDCRNIKTLTVSLTDRLMGCVTIRVKEALPRINVKEVFDRY